MGEKEDLEAEARAAWDLVAQATAQAEAATRKWKAVPSEGGSWRNPERSHHGLEGPSLTTVGFLLAALGAAALFIPWITVPNDTVAMSVSTAYGLCSTGLGEFAQGASQTVANECAATNVGFYGAWLVGLAGVVLLAWGVVKVAGAKNGD